MPEPRFRELAGGHRAQIITAGELRAGDRLAYHRRATGAVLWWPVAAIHPAGERSVRVAVDDGQSFDGYTWTTRRRTTALAIAPRRVYLARTLIDDDVDVLVLDEATHPDAAAATRWLAETLEQSPERQRRRMSGNAYPGEWITLNYALEDYEFQYDHDAPATQHALFVADAAGVTQTAGPRT